MSSTRRDDFRELVVSLRRPLLWDGAMGTLLYQRGIFLTRSFDELNLSHPDLVRQIHREYIEAGADIIGIGDAAASLIGPKFYEDSVLEYEQRIVDGLQAMGARVRLHICGNTQAIVDGMGRLGCEIVDLDYFTPVDMARKAMGPDQVLLGNIDPVRSLRNGTPESVTADIAQCHRQAGNRYIVGAGCEVPRDTPLANVRAMTEYALAHR